MDVFTSIKMSFLYYIYIYKIELLYTLMLILCCNCTKYTGFQFKMKVVIFLTIIVLYLEKSLSLNCSYIDDNLLNKNETIYVRSNYTNNDIIREIQIRKDCYLINKSLPKFCTRLEPVLTLKKIHIIGTNTVELGAEIFKRYKLELLEIQYNNITTIWSHTFVDISVIKIDMQYNKIRIIEDAAFKDLKHLKYLDLSNNNITLIKSNMFVNLISLESFILSRNLMQVLDTHNLDFLRHKPMTSLYLDTNLIRSLHQKSLSKLTLLSLHLEDNLLDDIGGDVFHESCIENIFIQFNNLSNSSKKMLIKICNLQKIYFSSTASLVNNKNELVRESHDVQIVVGVFLLSIIMISIGYYLYFKFYK